VRRPRAHAGEGPKSRYTNPRPNSPLGIINKLMGRQKICRELARPPKKTTLVFLCKAERRRGTTPHALITTHEFATRRRAESWTAREWRTTAATGQGSTTTTSWFLPPCELHSPISCFNSCPCPRYFFLVHFLIQINYLYSIPDFLVFCTHIVMVSFSFRC